MTPILFNTDMVQAILENRKTTTRRVAGRRRKAPCRPGDILYVRETWAEGADGFEYRADHAASDGRGWRPSIHMPKQAARIFLRVTSVRLKRLQKISDADAWEEGAEGVSCDCEDEIFCSRCYNTGWIRSPRSEFIRIWDSTLKSADRALYGWAANPWVWVIEFHRISREEAIAHDRNM